MRYRNVGRHREWSVMLTTTSINFNNCEPPFITTTPIAYTMYLTCLYHTHARHLSEVPYPRGQARVPCRPALPHSRVPSAVKRVCRAGDDHVRTLSQIPLLRYLRWLSEGYPRISPVRRASAAISEPCHQSPVDRRQNRAGFASGPIILPGLGEIRVKSTRYRNEGGYNRALL